MDESPDFKLRIRVGTQDANYSRIRRIRNSEKNQELLCAGTILFRKRTRNSRRTRWCGSSGIKQSETSRRWYCTLKVYCLIIRKRIRNSRRTRRRGSSGVKQSETSRRWYCTLKVYCLMFRKRIRNSRANPPARIKRS
jgi:hypothetical protein